MNTAQQGERIKELEAELFNTKELVDVLKTELRESKELIVAFVTQCGDFEEEAFGIKAWRLFLDDRNIANIAHDDLLNISYDNKRGGNVYEVRR